MKKVTGDGNYLVVLQGDWRMMKYIRPMTRWIKSFCTFIISGKRLESRSNSIWSSR